MTFNVHRDEGSKEILGFQWHITFGQAEAVAQLDFDGHQIVAADLPAPFKGGRLLIQHVKWFGPLNDLNFRFSGVQTKQADPNNPWWMTRVLGLKQHVIWGRAMRNDDLFAYEARDQPWQGTAEWGVPQTTPWIEGLWFVRNKSFVEGDQLTYGFENSDDYKR